MEIMKLNNNQNLIDICTNVKHLLVQMRYNLKLGKENQGDDKDTDN